MWYFAIRAPKTLSSEWVNLLFNVAINDISVIYVTAHRCAGGLKKELSHNFFFFFWFPVTWNKFYSQQLFTEKEHTI